MITGDTYGVLNRLILNEKIDPSPEGVLRILGFVHLYTASGLHLIALESFLQRFFGRTLTSQRVLTMCFWFFLILLWKLQGFRLGFTRILLLFFMKAWAKESGHTWRKYYPLFFAFCFDMLAGIESGWQHYYLAILGGMVGMDIAARQRRGEFAKHLYLSVGSWLLTAPLDMIEHHTLSWMTPIWSMLTIPIISLALYPLSVISYLLMGDVPSWLMQCWNQGLEILFNLVDLGLTFSVLDLRTMLISFGLAMLAFFLCKRPIHLVLLVLAFLCVRVHPLYRTRGIQLSQLNVGQGDSLLIRNQDRFEMVDVGPSQKNKPDTMIHRIAHHGVTHLDSILLSHLDDDHAGGLKWMLPWIPIASVETNPAFDRASVIQSWVESGANSRFCEKECFQSGVVDWVSSRGSTPNRKSSNHRELAQGELTHRYSIDQNLKYSKLNLLKSKKSKMASRRRRSSTEKPNGKATGNSLMGIAMIPLSEDTLYLSLGDSDIRQEAEVWSRHHWFIEQFPHRILKISHHGSHHSSDPEFVRAVDPELAVISVGKRNRYRHPHFSVVHHLKLDGIGVHRTDRDGDYVVSGPGVGLAPAMGGRAKW
jgi:competence protein ComEC